MGEKVIKNNSGKSKKKQDNNQRKIFQISNLTVYYKMRQISLQNATTNSLQNTTKVYYKMHQAFYYKMQQFYYKMRQLLQKGMII